MRKHWAHWLATFIISICVANLAEAQNSRDAERKLDRIKQELTSVARERRKLESERGDASMHLRQADEQVSSSLLALQTTQAELRRERAALNALRTERTALQQGLGEQRQELARLLRAAYTVGDDAPLKVLLAQDRIANVDRVLTYHGYLQRQRKQRIAALTRRLAKLNALEQQIALRQAKLDRAFIQQREQLDTLESDRKSRVNTVSKLEQKYRDRSSREKALGRDAKALEKLLSQLRAAARRAAAAKETQSSAQSAPTQAGEPLNKTASRMAKAPAMQVGGTGWPVSGALLAGFGTRLPDGRTSTGLLIGAPAGTAVRAMADGNVVFSEWMTGYGMILIVDHGNGYMSLYAHNDALLRKAGDAVKRGEAIASVGNSGGQGRPGLYFELRYQGQPVNPQSWLQKR